MTDYTPSQPDLREALANLHVVPMQALRADEDVYVVWNAAVEATVHAIEAAFASQPAPADPEAIE